MALCPGQWSMTMALRAFREQILATWEREEIVRLQETADAAMIAPAPQHWSVLERLPLVNPISDRVR